MIKVKVEKDKITITGHANYAEYGSDIVCAAVSATIMTSIEGISIIDNEVIDIKQEKDKLDIIINKHVDSTDKLIENMLNCLNEIANQYPKNVKIINRDE